MTFRLCTNSAFLRYFVVSPLGWECSLPELTTVKTELLKIQPARHILLSGFICTAFALPENLEAQTWLAVVGLPCQPPARKTGGRRSGTSCCPRGRCPSGLCTWPQDPRQKRILEWWETSSWHKETKRIRWSSFLEANESLNKRARSYSLPTDPHTLFVSTETWVLRPSFSHTYIILGVTIIEVPFATWKVLFCFLILEGLRVGKIRMLCYQTCQTPPDQSLWSRPSLPTL